jgi:hypothetical protein
MRRSQRRRDLEDYVERARDSERAPSKPIAQRLSLYELCREGCC